MRRGDGRRKTRAHDVVAEDSEGFKAFCAYYREQALVPDDEWGAFMSAMRSPLPTVARVNLGKPAADALQAAFAADPRWRQLPWYPGGAAWQCGAADVDAELRTRLGELNKAYALRLQEAASLVPALLLEPRPGDLVLDMAAAPGGKSLQMLELMAAGGGGGAVVANDGDAERAMELLPLIVRKARVPGVAVTLGSATKFPAVFEVEKGERRQVLFDRVLCDVPCSGDATARKAPGVLQRWGPEAGARLHRKQLSILLRGLHLLRVGGRLVYSTCSLNPVENEAVVAAALRAFRGDVDLVRGAASALEAGGLRARPGLTTWRAAEAPAPAGRVSPTPPEQGTVEAEALRHVVRLLPHDNDTSGFFVAVFTKTRHRDACHFGAPAEDGAATGGGPAAGEAASEPGAPPAAVEALPWRARNDLNRYEVLDLAAHPEAAAIAEAYGLDLAELPGRVLAERNIHGAVRQLLLVGDRLLAYLTAELGQRRSPLLISCGVPLFKRLDDNFLTEVGLKCRWRPALEAAALLGAACAKRVVLLGPETLGRLLAARRLDLAELQRLAAAGDGEVQGLGSCEGKLGGVVVRHRGCPDFCLPGVVTGAALEVYASTEELGDVPGSAPPLPPPPAPPREGAEAASPPAP